MYSLSQLRTVAKDPRWLYREPLRIYNHAQQNAPYYTNGIDIFERDWDNLIILDAARYDEYAMHTPFDTPVEPVISRGATSSEFIVGNFSNRQLDDTVYISVNPHFARLRDEINSHVHAYIALHNSKHRDAVGGLTTRPETVNEISRSAAEDYPNKRLIIHYLQPHQPYLGEAASTEINHGHGLIDTIRKNDISPSKLREYYRENLNLVLEQVTALLPHLMGKTVVTADHGEILGERTPIPVIRDYGHWEGIYVNELLQVPWQVVRDGPRKTIIEESSNMDDINMSDVSKNLEDLGYL